MPTKKQNNQYFVFLWDEKKHRADMPCSVLAYQGTKDWVEYILEEDNVPSDKIRVICGYEIQVKTKFQIQTKKASK